MLSSRTALVVDDSSFARTMLKDILLKNGFSKVYEAKDATEAVESFKKFSPDIVTMDIIMPDRDGLAALKDILEADKKAKVVMVTSVGQDHVVQKAMELGAKDYIMKPFESSTVAKVTDKLLGT